MTSVSVAYSAVVTYVYICRLSQEMCRNSVDQNVILLEYYDNYVSWLSKISEKYTDSK